MPGNRHVFGESVNLNPPGKPPKPIELPELPQTLQLQEEYHVKKLVHLLSEMPAEPYLWKW